MSRLLALYPRAWRRRYGEELLSLIAVRPPNAGDRLDLVLGAIDAHLHPYLVTPEPPAGRPMRDISPGDLRIARRLGVGAMLGGIAWLAAWVIAANGPIVYDPGGSYRDGAAALPVLLLAGVLLVGGFIGHVVLLPAGARVARVAAFVAICCTLLWTLGPWLMPIGAAALAGLTILAVAGWRAGTWPAAMAGVVVILAVAVPALLVAGMPAGRSISPVPLSVVAAFSLTSAIWLIVGGTLIRAPQAATGSA
jgi:hypothetical protein